MSPDTAPPASELEDLTELLYLIPTGVVQIDAAGKIGFINPLAVQLLMPVIRPGDKLANLFDSLARVAPDLRQIVRDFGEERGNILQDHQIVVSHGGPGQAGLIVYAISLVKLDEARIMVSLQDVSESARRERLIRQQDAWINAVLLGVSDYAVTLLDAFGRITHWNEGLQRLCGLAEADALGRPCSVLFSADACSDDRLQDRLQEASQGGLSLDEGWMLRADGDRFWGHSVITPCAPGAPLAGYALVIRNITDHRQSMNTLLKAATRDQLTELANRRSFFDALALEVMRYQRRPRPLSLLTIDIDHLAQINERHGEPAGDAVIRDLARILASSVRDFDVVARTGGEAFGVLLPSTVPDAAHTVAERIRSLVEQGMVNAAGVSIRYTVSIGIAGMQPHFAGAAPLVEAAERALSTAKRAGRNRVCMMG